MRVSSFLRLSSGCRGISGRVDVRREISCTWPVSAVGWRRGRIGQQRHCVPSRSPADCMAQSWNRWAGFGGIIPQRSVVTFTVTGGRVQISLHWAMPGSASLQRYRQKTCSKPDHDDYRWSQSCHSHWYQTTSEWDGHQTVTQGQKGQCSFTVTGQNALLHCVVIHGWSSTSKVCSKSPRWSL